MYICIGRGHRVNLEEVEPISLVHKTSLICEFCISRWKLLYILQIRSTLVALDIQHIDEAGSIYEDSDIIKEVSYHFYNMSSKSLH